MPVKAPDYRRTNQPLHYNDFSTELSPSSPPSHNSLGDKDVPAVLWCRKSTCQRRKRGFGSRTGWMPPTPCSLATPRRRRNRTGLLGPDRCTVRHVGQRKTRQGPCFFQPRLAKRLQGYHRASARNLLGLDLSICGYTLLVYRHESQHAAC